MKKIYFLFLVVILSSCAAVYRAPTFENEKHTHKIIAILPFKTSISAKRLPKGVTDEMLQRQAKEASYLLQNQVYTFFLRKTNEIEFQDIAQTNALLKQAGIEYEDLNGKSREEICKILNVDVVLSGTCVMSKPLSDGTAIALGLLVGFWGPTNEVSASLSIHNRTGKLQWKYDHEMRGGVGSSSEWVGRYLMKNVSKKFPYRINSSSY
jgi:hypothetical protein